MLWLITLLKVTGFIGQNQYEEAMSFFMKLDAQKSPEIMNRIGFMYDAGRGVERNGNIAFQWYRKAAETGLAKAQYNLGLCFQNGIGVKKDINEAIKWYLKAAEQGYPDAESKMGYLDRNRKRRQTGFQTGHAMVPACR